jgi:hypothetical protein
MEIILGQPCKFAYCTRYSVLTDELCKLQKETTVVVISCLSGIVATLLTTSDAKSAIEKVMTSLGSILRDLVRSNPRMRIMIVNCTPRGTPEYDEQSSFAMVTFIVLIE